MVIRFVWRTGLEVNARGTAEQLTILKDTTIAVLKMGPRYVWRTGMDQTVRCTVHQEMTPWDITGAILMTAVKYVIPNFTAEIAQHIVFQNKAICMVIMTAMLRMVVRSATVTGMEETVACIVKDEMTPKVITSVMQ